MKEIKLIDSYYNGPLECLVHMEEGVGITVVAKNNPDHYILCFQGTQSPLFDKKQSSDENIRMYKAIETMVNDGLIDIDILHRQFIEICNEEGYIDGGASAERCSFNQ